MSLDPQDVEAVAQRVAQLLDTPAAPAPVRLVDAAQLARALGVRRDWVYRHAEHLGAIRLGGPAGRLRFDLHRATSQLASTQEGALAGAASPGVLPRHGPALRGLDVSRSSSYGRRDQRPSGRATRQRPRP